MFVHDGPPRYGAYLLRHWKVRSDRPGQPSAWQFSLEEAETGERHGFHDLEALVAYLARELAQEAAGATGAPGCVEMDEQEQSKGRLRKRQRRNGDEDEGT